MNATRRLTLATLVPISVTPLVAQEHEHGAAPEQLGTVRFETSYTAAAQPLFNRATALLHSFELGRAIDGFGAALAADPSCAMAEWR